MCQAGAERVKNPLGKIICLHCYEFKKIDCITNSRIKQTDIERSRLTKADKRKSLTSVHKLIGKLQLKSIISSIEDYLKS